MHAQGQGVQRGLGKLQYVPCLLLHLVFVSSIFQALDSLSFSGKVHNLNLDKCCPVTREVQTSFGKLQELCQVKSIKEWHNDARWLSSLESARWLNSVK